MTRPTLSRIELRTADLANANWDIFHSDRLEVERNLTSAAVRSGIAKGAILGDDLARPAGSSDPWTRLFEHPVLSSALASPAPPPTLSGPMSLQAMLEDDDEDNNDENGTGSDDEVEDLSQFVLDEDLDQGEPVPRRSLSAGMAPLPSGVNKATTEDLDPVGFPDSYDRDLDLSLRDPRHTVSLDDDDNDDEDDYDPEEEDEEAAGFTFSRAGAETVEELDLAAMVDVAFQLVLFFLVTASTIVFKALEVPKPNPDKTKGGHTQTQGKTMDELKDDYILVEIDANGAVKIDRENSPNDFAGLTGKLRKLRQDSGRVSMLLTADSATLHKYAVLAYDAANEIGLRIAVAQPKAATPAAPVPPVAPK